MRIGFDMLAVQSPQHGERGIGRYSENLVSALLERGGHEYVLYVHDNLPTHRIPQSAGAEYRLIRPRWEIGETMSPSMDRLVRLNPDGLDVFVVLSPFESWASYAPPAPPSKGGPRMAVVIYDLIPFIQQNEFVLDKNLVSYYQILETISHYDSLLAISDATRFDCHSLLQTPPERVVNISAASDPTVFYPPKSSTISLEEQQALTSLGITKPFILNVGGLDDRKNTWRLIEAFAGLPERHRNGYQLVLTFMINEWGRSAVFEHLHRHGLEDSIVLTGHASDTTLRLLYQRCDVFALPSLYEGFGLPILEAMHCAAPVLVGNNSSQIEVVENAGVFVDAGDSKDILARLLTLLDDRQLAGELGARGVEQAKKFSWRRTVDATLNAFQSSEDRSRSKKRLRFDRSHKRKPTLAFFSPLPPRKSGVSDYSAFLLDELRKHYTLDLFHDTGYVPQPALMNHEDMSCDYRLFERVAARKDYHAIVYQMGNSRYHTYMYNILLKHPGLVTLHDFCLAGYHLYYGHMRGMGRGFIADELRRWYPEDRVAIENALATWPESWEEIARDCASKGWHLNRRILDAAQVMVVHSPWCARQTEKDTPEHSAKVVVIPHGIHPRRATQSQRAAVRERFQLPQDALIIGSFGFVHPDKMSPQALDAFSVISPRNEKALFIFVGEEADGGVVQRHAQALGIDHRVRFLGRQPAEAFIALMSVTDVGVNLRLPPTNGETSGALLNLLAAGVPTVVTDVATFSDYPTTVVRKVHWETEGQAGLLRAMADLCGEPEYRRSLGRSAWTYVDDHHEWSRVANQYVEAIERCHDELSRSRSEGRKSVPHARPGRDFQEAFRSAH
ncbi:MAG: hypothetical protein NVSMB9_06460 [Isosphaeraceae bacterium]